MAQGGSTEKQWLNWSAVVLALAALVLVVVVGARVSTSVGEISDAHAAGIKMAYINYEEAFKIFTTAVAYERQRAQAISDEITETMRRYEAGEIEASGYRMQVLQLRSELYLRQIEVGIKTIDRMLSSELFSDMHPALESLRQEAEVAHETAEALYQGVRAGGDVDMTEKEEILARVISVWEDLDGLLVNACEVAMQEATEAVAVERGFDVVFRKRNVVVYRNAVKLHDLTDTLRLYLLEYMP